MMTPHLDGNGKDELGLHGVHLPPLALAGAREHLGREHEPLGRVVGHEDGGKEVRCSVVQADGSQEQRAVRPAQVLGTPEQELVVPQVPLLRSERQALAVVGPSQVVVRHGLLRAGGVVQVDQQAADHQAGAGLAGLAVHRHHVVRALPQPGLGGLHEGLDQTQRWAVVVVEREARDLAVEELRVVGSLRAQVVDLVSTPTVFLI